MSKKPFFSKKTISLAEQLQVVSKKSKDEIHRRDAAEMVQFYIRNGFWPIRLKNRAFELISLNKSICRGLRKPERVINRHYLYAIQAGDNLKVGYSVNPFKRLKSMQVGNPNKLSVVWNIFCATDDKEARYQEKRLHRFISGYKVRGEWFSIKALNKLRGFKVRNKSVMQEEPELKILFEAEKKI